MGRGRGSSGRFRGDGRGTSEVAGGGGSWEEVGRETTHFSPEDDDERGRADGRETRAIKGSKEGVVSFDLFVGSFEERKVKIWTYREVES